MHFDGELAPDAGERGTHAVTGEASRDRVEVDHPLPQPGVRRLRGVMQILPTSIAGVHCIVPVVHRDHRGWFHRSFDEAILAAAGLPVHWPQHNASQSLLGVVRGMHVRVGQGESKIVRCEHGAIDDVVIDVRPDSLTFRRQVRFRLDADDHRQLYLPPGVAHGYQALTDVAVVCYLHSAPYVADEERSFRHDDPALAITWSIKPAVTSDRDAAAPLLADFLAGR